MDLEHLISDLMSLKAALPPNAPVGVKVSGSIAAIIGVGIHKGGAYMLLEDLDAADTKGQKDKKVDAKNLRSKKG